MARRPKPTSLHVLEGTYRPDRHGPAEPPADGGPVDPPPHLSDEARALWESLAPEMRAKGLLTPLLSVAFECWVTSVVQMRKCARLVTEMGPVVTNRDGHQVAHPASRELRAHSNLVRLWSAELGVTPAAAAALGRRAAEPLSEAEKRAARFLT